MNQNRKKEAKSLLAILLVLAVVLLAFIAPKVSTEAADTGYTEMRFGDWGTSEGSVDLLGYPLELYSLTNSDKITSLDGVAISGKVNFNGTVRTWITIGGTADVKYAGFWLGAVQEHGWAMACQGVGTGYNDTINWSEKAKFETEVELRLTFDKAKDSDTWTIKVYADNIGVGTWTYSGITPGTYIGLPQGVDVDMTPSAPQMPAYHELTFSDWGDYAGTAGDFIIYNMTDSSTVTSLDGVAINGKINFNGTSRKWISIGGTDEVKNGGFWLGAMQEHGWSMIPQGIGGNHTSESTMWNEAAKFNTEVELRLTFDKAEDSNNWTIHVYVDDELIGRNVYEGVTPGIYIGVDPAVTVEGLDTEIPTPIEPEIPEFPENYKEFAFSDFGIYSGVVEGIDIYSLKGHSNITTLDGVSIRGKVNFNDINDGMIRVGGTDVLKQAGFWLFNDGSCLRLSPQGIGADTIEHHVMWEDSWVMLKNTEIDLKMTFNKDSSTQEWWIGIYINSEQVGVFNCGAVSPGLYLGVDPTITVDGLGDVVKNSGLDFTLFGYSNQNWRKEMGLK